MLEVPVAGLARVAGTWRPAIAISVDRDAALVRVRDERPGNDADQMLALELPFKDFEPLPRDSWPGVGDQDTIHIGDQPFSIAALAEHLNAVKTMLDKREEWVVANQEAMSRCLVGLLQLPNKLARAAPSGVFGPPQVALYPAYAVKHAVEAVIILNNAVTTGAFAGSLALMRQCLEACNVAAAGLLDEPQRTDVLSVWFEHNRGDRPQTELQQALRRQVWPRLGWQVPWGGQWARFFDDLQAAMPLLAHFTSRVMQWHQKVLWMPVSRDDLKDAAPKGVLAWESFPSQAVDSERASRLYLLQSLLVWVLARIGTELDRRRGDDIAELDEAILMLGDALCRHPDWPVPLTRSSLMSLFFPAAGYFGDRDAS